MRRYAIVWLTMTALTLGMAYAPASCAWAASEVATLKAITVSAGPPCEELVVRVDGAYAYKAVQVAPDVLFIDLAGAQIGSVPRSASWSTPLMSGYRLLQFQDASGRSVVRVQVDTRRAEPFVIQRDRAALRVLFGTTASEAPPIVASPAAAAATVPAAVVAPASAHGSVMVSNVTFDKRESGETFVDISTSRTASYHVMVLKHPARLVVDIEGARASSRQRSFVADTLVLHGVRIGQFREKDPPVVRVVADLNGDPAFEVHTTPGGVRIELRPRGMTGPTLSLAKTTTPAPGTRRPEAKPAPEASSGEPPVAAAKASTLEPTTEVINRKPVAAIPVQAAPLDAAKPDVQSTLPPTESSKQVAAAPLPRPSDTTPEALRAEQAARTLTAGTPQTPPPAAQETPPGSVNPPAEDKEKFTGEPISLNLKDVDLKDFFRLIHEISGLNIIVDPNVSGSVTMVLDSVPWDQALDIVLKNNRLGKTLEGNVLRIAKVETLTAEQEEAAKLAAARQNAAPLVTIFQPLNYAKAGIVATLLKSWAGGGALSRRGTVLVDERANTLIISDIQAQIPIIQGILAKLDKKSKQVSIEARVVLATANFTRNLQAALSGAARTTQGSTLIGGVTGTGAQITPGVTFPSLPPTQTIEQTSAGGFGAVAISNASSRYLINAVIAASEERDEAKTISRPTIVTQNNVQGRVMQGTQVPIQTNINNTISVQYENATLELTVTPQVTDDGNIFMMIQVTNASVGAVLTNAGPSINTQSATTQVMVPDGGTVVFGGITVTGRSKSATYVPWLGSIPILGHLFKSSNVQDQDQELLFFVSPKILTS
jgi:type IV pilus secretin PilQ/predicted competence protein